MTSKLKVLIADDDGFVRDMLASILEAGGYEVRTAENGDDALEKYHYEPDIRLILSDMNMPKSDGLDLIRQLRRRQNDIPIIILTANSEIRTALDAIRSGADDYLLKDENIEDTLLISVENVMEKQRLRQENIRLLEELSQKNKALERLSFLDGLTGIANRRYFDKTMAQEWEDAIRNSTPLSLLMMDIDFFKNFNDTYGHLHGDDCLRQVANALRNAVKNFGDSVFRYGGEEFAAILPGINADRAFSVAELMRVDVAGLNIPHANSNISEQITISVGVGTAIPSPQSVSSELISRVDQALYQAKREGRNRVNLFFNSGI